MLSVYANRKYYKWICLHARYYILYQKILKYECDLSSLVLYSLPLPFAQLSSPLLWFLLPASLLISQILSSLLHSYLIRSSPLSSILLTLSLLLSSPALPYSSPYSSPILPNSPLPSPPLSSSSIHSPLVIFPSVSLYSPLHLPKFSHCPTPNIVTYYLQGHLTPPEVTQGHHMTTLKDDLMSTANPFAK